MLEIEIAAAVGAIFGAGVAWGVLKGEVRRARTDLNGVRRIVNEQAIAARSEQDRVKLAILLLTPEERMERMIDRFWAR